ncbi:hypothetical protein AB0O64_30155 [Streptomyces sp. NPDC088341]|uniref:hypothetical protein n=1 Tax=Streptomyces sp. NPDC088341 TaxID=3154870 RepID=UPI003423842F
MTSPFDSFRIGNAGHSPRTTRDAIAGAFDAGFRHLSGLAAAPRVDGKDLGRGNTNHIKY